MNNPTDLDLSYQARNTTTGAVLAWVQCTERGRYEVRHADGHAETHRDRWSALLALGRLAEDGDATAARPQAVANDDDPAVEAVANVLTSALSPAQQRAVFDRYHATEPADRVSEAVTALRAFGGELDATTARALLGCWRHRDRLSPEQVEEVVLLASAGGAS